MSRFLTPYNYSRQQVRKLQFSFCCGCPFTLSSTIMILFAGTYLFRSETDLNLQFTIPNSATRPDFFVSWQLCTQKIQLHISITHCTDNNLGVCNVKALRPYLSTIPTLNSHLNSHFLLSKSGISFLRSGNFSKKNSHF